ncbi:MAG: hypothetical protein C4K58_06735 [Flavobacteriaceae bacterium]|nr:MAG: hypothetical protein C4K58_06735 [Flavobacteriaceae bacterium]
MKLYLLTFLTTISSLTLFGQNNDTWTSFWNKDSTLIGYKDKNGVVKIEPKFSGFINANKFDNIIAVSEVINEYWNYYYLTKSGKIIGRDSLHVFDNTPDCESEGFIRFRDHKTDKVGMFNKNGDIAIPAIYNDLERVKNGMIIALKGADRWRQGEYYGWNGGQEVLIDTLNNILVENFNYNKPLNFFTLEKTQTPHSDTIRKSFLAKDGSYYSFVDFEKEFKQWITKELSNDLTVEKLINISYDTITWKSKDGWVKTNRQKLITDNFTILKNGLLEILEPKTKYFISIDGLNPFMFEDTEFEKYFNNCEESKDWIYPTMSIIISHGDKKSFTQNHYTFLRTDDGYKLISLTIRNKKLK